MKINSKSYCLNDLVDVLRRNNQIPIVARELILDEAISNIKIPDEKEKVLIKQFRIDNKLEDESSFSSYLKQNYLDSNALQCNLERIEKIAIFKEETWGPRAQSFYLQCKDKYDKISMNIISNPSKDAIQEIYFRIKDGEETWQSMANMLSRNNQPLNYKVGPVAVSAMPEIIVKTMLQHGKSVITTPISHNNTFYIAELLEVHSTKFDATIKEKILSDALDSWLDNAIKDLADNIQFD